MGAVASITIMVDDKGAVSALNNVTGATEKMSPAFQKSGAMSSRVMTQMVNDHQRAHDSANLLARTLGVEMPRSLERIISKSSLVGPALSSAFNISVFAALGAAAINLAQEQIPALIESFTHWREEAERTMKETAELNKVLTEQKAKIKELREQYGLIGLEGLPRVSKEQEIAAKHYREAQKEVEKLITRQRELINQSHEMEVIRSHAASKLGPAEYTSVQTAAAKLAQEKLKGMEADLIKAQENADVLGQELQNTGKELSAAFGKERREGLALTNQALQTLLEKLGMFRSQAESAGQSGIGAIAAKERQALEEVARIEALYGEIPMVREQAEKASVGIVAGATRERIALYEDEAKKKLGLIDESIDADSREARERLELERQLAKELTQIETDAAIAMLPPWQQADAQIVEDARKRIDEIRALEAQDGAFRIRGERDVALIMQKEWHDRVVNMANQLEGLYDEITSGGIGQFFLKRFKHLVFQMIAAWMQGLNQMRSAAQGAMGGGIGGIFTSILGSLFGVNLGGGGGSGGTAAGGTAAISSGGAMSSSAGAGGVLSPSAALDSLPVGLRPSEADAFNFLGGPSLSAGQGAGMAGMTLPAGAVVGSAAAGSQASMLARLGGLGGVFGMLASGGLSLLGMKNTALRGLGGFLTGGVLGSIVAMSSIGASLGAVGAFLGPIGAVVGLLAGLFLHGSTRKARLKIEGEIKQQAQAIEDAYKTYQIDFSGARDQLEQLRQQGVDALRQAGVKDISRSRVGHVDHWIDKAENEIKAMEADRAARLAIAFGPAQFRIGGFVSPNLARGYPALFGANAMHFAGGGAVPAILHGGEFVMRSEAVQRVGRGNLERMNGGGTGGEVHNHFYIDALDARSFESFLSGGGAAKIVASLRRGDGEGHWSFRG